MEGAQGEAFDRVYCVFDRDSYHLAAQNKVYQTALARIANSLNFFATNSVPSFEYWYLLHFCETRQQFAAQGKKSVGDMVEKELKKYWPDYEKGMSRPYESLKKILPAAQEQAIERSKRILAQAQADGDENPSTRVHELVEYLLNIKKQK